MQIRTLFEGHYRALEDDFLELTLSLIDQQKKLTIVSAGTGQLDRLTRILLDSSGRASIGGVTFLPGIGHLARKTGIIPSLQETVSHSDRTLLSLHAMESLKKGEPLFDLRGNPDTAHSMGSFFENLLDRGITPELYEISSLSLSRGQTNTEKTVGRIFDRYYEERSRGYFSCGDTILEREISDNISGPYIFYGFYDLNPSQRRYLRRFMRTAGDVHWFSPLSENSQWKSVYLRTRKLLENIGIRSVVRSGNRKQMNSFAEFFEALPKQFRPTIPAADFGITAVSGEIGACRAVLNRINELTATRGIQLDRIAVVRRKQDGGSLIRLAHHEGIPVNAALKSKLSEVPEGVFVLNLMKAVSMDFYYIYLENLLASGILKDSLAAEPSRIAEIVESTGVRMGLTGWRDWYSSQEGGNRAGSFLRKLDTFFSGLPEKAYSGQYLNLIRDFFDEVTAESLSASMRGTLFNPDVFRFKGEVTAARFIDSLRFYYQSKDIVLRKPSPEGFRIFSIEKVRGNLFDSVLLMDMEEGIFPGSPEEDPRLSDELRERLQMSLKSQRETEDGFLLRQAGESASKTLEIIYREQDSSGAEVSPSPFISAISLPGDDYAPDPAWFRRTSSSAVEQFLNGSHSGQRKAMAVRSGKLPDEAVYAEALKAEISRMSLGAFNEHDGVLDSSPISKKSFSPTFLERYIRCPFAFLIEKGWNAQRTEIKDISNLPDPLTKGNFIHDAVEETVKRYGLNPSRQAVEAVLKAVAVSQEVTRSFGAEYLLEIFLRKQVETIMQSLNRLSSTGWRYLDREKYLEGHLGTLKINGRIDLIMEDGDSNLVLIDLKTGKIPVSGDILKGKLFQLPFYYKLARESYPDRGIASIAYVAISDITPGKLCSFTGTEMEGIMETVTGYAERIVYMIREGLFPPIPTAGCGNCLYRELCRRNPYDRIRRKSLSDDRMKIFRGIMLKT